MSSATLDRYAAFCSLKSVEEQNVMNKNLEYFVSTLRDAKSKGERQGLLLGHIQSGKTSHIFGIICQVLDAQIYDLFVILTSDNTSLYDQTYKRALEELAQPCQFNVCSKGQDGEIRYATNGQGPTIVILSKNKSILDSWVPKLAKCDRPYMIIDDEADAASLNGKIRQKKITEINRQIVALIDGNSSTFYLQVTATPYALMLQSESGYFRPSFCHLIQPGAGYLGGQHFFEFGSHRRTIQGKAIALESDDGDVLSSTLQEFIINFLVVACFFKKRGMSTCNALFHDSQSIKSHARAANCIKKYIRGIATEPINDQLRILLYQELANLTSNGNTDIENLDELVAMLPGVAQSIQVHTINGHSEKSSSGQAVWDSNFNLLVGGNRLSRGVTIPYLQCTFYARERKNPNMDTMWQHCRQFGYERLRVKPLLSNWVSDALFAQFTSIWRANTALYAQSEDNVKQGVVCGAPIRPTRTCVIPKSTYTLIGGRNYYIECLQKQDHNSITSMLKQFGRSGEKITISRLDLMMLLSEVKPDEEEKVQHAAWLSFLSALSDVTCQIVFREHREVTFGTGTLLSAEDSYWASEKLNCVRAIFYHANKERGWGGDKWVPAITFPDKYIFYINNGRPVLWRPMQ
jgi:hypothetical protein